MTGRRRSHGEGSVFQRASDGRWVGRVDVGHADGKRKRVTVYGTTEREVLGKLREVVKAKERGQDFTTRRRTVAEWLTEWLDEVKATDGTRPQTVRWYRWLVEHHVSPTVGGIKLDRLTPAEFARFHDLNARYRARFGFPFIVCVRLTDKAGILAAMEARLANDPATEIDTAIAEIGRITKLRLEDMA